MLDNASTAAGCGGTALDALARFFDLTIACRSELILPLHGSSAPTTDATRAVRADVHRTLQEILDRGRRDGTVRADATPGDVVYFGAVLAEPLPATDGWDGIAHRLKQIYVDGLAATRPR